MPLAYQHVRTTRTTNQTGNKEQKSPRRPVGGSSGRQERTSATAGHTAAGQGENPKRPFLKKGGGRTCVSSKATLATPKAPTQTAPLQRTASTAKPAPEAGRNSSSCRAARAEKPLDADLIDLEREDPEGLVPGCKWGCLEEHKAVKEWLAADLASLISRGYYRESAVPASCMTNNPVFEADHESDTVLMGSPRASAMPLPALGTASSCTPRSSRLPLSFESASPAAQQSLAGSGTDLPVQPTVGLATAAGLEPTPAFPAAASKRKATTPASENLTKRLRRAGSSADTPQLFPAPVAAAAKATAESSSLQSIASYTDAPALAAGRPTPDALLDTFQHGLQLTYLTKGNNYNNQSPDGPPSDTAPVADASLAAGNADSPGWSAPLGTLAGEHKLLTWTSQEQCMVGPAAQPERIFAAGDELTESTDAAGQPATDTDEAVHPPAGTLCRTAAGLSNHEVQADMPVFVSFVSPAKGPAKEQEMAATLIAELPGSPSSQSQASTDNTYNPAVAEHDTEITVTVASRVGDLSSSAAPLPASPQEHVGSPAQTVDAQSYTQDSASAPIDWALEQAASASMPASILKATPLSRVLQMQANATMAAGSSTGTPFFSPAVYTADCPQTPARSSSPQASAFPHQGGKGIDNLDYLDDGLSGANISLAMRSPACGYIQRLWQKAAVAVDVCFGWFFGPQSLFTAPEPEVDAVPGTPVHQLRSAIEASPISPRSPSAASLLGGSSPTASPVRVRPAPLERWNLITGRLHRLHTDLQIAETRLCTFEVAQPAGNICTEDEAQPGSTPSRMAPELTEPQMPLMAYDSATAASHELAPAEEGSKLEPNSAGLAHGEARRTARGLKENSPPISMRKNKSGATEDLPSLSQQTPPRHTDQPTSLTGVTTQSTSVTHTQRSRFHAAEILPLISLGSYHTSGSRNVGLTILVPTEAEDLPSLESSSPTGLTPLLPKGFSLCPAAEPLSIDISDSHGEFESDSPTGLTPAPRAADGFQSAPSPGLQSSRMHAVSLSRPCSKSGLAARYRNVTHVNYIFDSSDDEDDLSPLPVLPRARKRTRKPIDAEEAEFRRQAAALNIRISPYFPRG